MSSENQHKFWRDLKISAKFTVGFGLLLFLLLTIAASGYFSIQHIHKAEITIENNREIQRLVLAMDRSLQRAKHLHADFFLNYQLVGLQKAHEQYAQPSIRETAKAITLSSRLQKLLNTAQTGNALREHHVDLSLYLSSAKRFAKTSIASFELITELSAPKTGQKMLLSTHFSALQKDIDQYRSFHEMLEETELSFQKYYLTKKRFIIQNAANTITKIRQKINQSPHFDKQRKKHINATIDHLSSTAKRIVEINEGIKSVFKDFNLQEKNLATTAQTLMALAGSEVEQAQEKINRHRSFTLQINIIIFAFGLVAALTIAWLLHKNITNRIQRLTKSAEKLKEGDLSVTFEDDGKDELGILAYVFNTMTSQRSADIKRLNIANQNLSKAQNILESTVDDRTNELKKLLDFSNRITHCPDIASLFRECISLPKNLLKFDYSTLMLLSPDQKRLTIMDTIGLPESTIGTFSLVEGQGLSTYAVQQKQFAAVSDFNSEKRFDIPPIVFNENITSALCAPMMIGDKVFGVLIGHTNSQNDFSESETSLYQSFANQAAMAIDNALHVKEIEESENKFRTFFDNSNDAFIVFGLDGSILEINKAACDSMGYSRKEFLTINMIDIVAPEFSPRLPQRLKDIANKGKQFFESACQHKDRTIIPIELSCTFFEFNNTPAILAVARDISERKMIEKELIKIERLESIGVLAGGIAHDFNNILASILGNINLARLDEELRTETHELLKEAEKASIRARGLTQQLLTFAKGGEPVKEVTQVAEIIRDCGDFVLRGSNVSCQYYFADDLWFSEIDKGQISQVIQNLIINARHAMPGGGTISIHSQNIQDPQAFTMAANSGRYIEITIEDQGIGIPTHIIDKIFDPYFTTKQEGSGLGLAVSHSIITKHGGFIFASSAQEKGTTFTIYLPATSAPESPAPATINQPQKKDRHPSGKVMIMDDDPMVQQVTKAMLEHLGYDVIQATDGREAIKLFTDAQNAKREIDIIIMDLTIPGGMGGKEAVQEILAIKPDAKVMVSSGYSNDPVMANFKQYGFKAAVTKPFQIQELKKVTAQLILS